MNNRIEFRPICGNCGKELHEVIDYEVAGSCDPWSRLPKGIIEPYRCPNCGAVFDCIIMPTGLPFDNRKEVNWFD